MGRGEKKSKWEKSPGLYNTNVRQKKGAELLRESVNIDRLKRPFDICCFIWGRVGGCKVYVTWLAAGRFLGSHCSTSLISWMASGLALGIRVARLVGTHCGQRKLMWEASWYPSGQSFYTVQVDKIKRSQKCTTSNKIISISRKIDHFLIIDISSVPLSEFL